MRAAARGGVAARPRRLPRTPGPRPRLRRHSTLARSPALPRARTLSSALSPSRSATGLITWALTSFFVLRWRTARRCGMAGSARSSMRPARRRRSWTASRRRSRSCGTTRCASPRPRCRRNCASSHAPPTTAPSWPSSTPNGPSGASSSTPRSVPSPPSPPGSASASHPITHVPPNSRSAPSMATPCCATLCASASPPTNAAYARRQPIRLRRLGAADPAPRRIPQNRPPPLGDDAVYARLIATLSSVPALYAPAPAPAPAARSLTLSLAAGSYAIAACGPTSPSAR